MNWRDVITADSSICHGKPCFAGTRIPVTVVLDNLAAGLDPAAIRRSYPTLSDTHIRAALNYAAELARERVVSFASHVA